MEINTFPSNSTYLLIVLLLLCTSLCRTESSIPSDHHEPLSITGRRMMSAIGTPSSTSPHAPGGGGNGRRRLMSGTGVQGSTSGHGGGHIHKIISLSPIKSLTIYVCVCVFNFIFSAYKVFD
ncbi:PREDICTED: uncharacterized protein LOC104771630 [Camelina sativa]|uniref:Uncharacterized protein LOC104771630 n=1 Tax=Camelina sativa TaxID=90675 RepID=A0ABM0Y2K7_CAMSA|nr:PREDICTED: uncharacterized protein LOC104771630 [Camelina sativa]